MSYRIGFYIRVSTEEQAENPEGSIRNQEERLKEVVKFKNLNGHFGDITQTYIERGRSGKDMNRPELQRLLAAIQRKEINMVMVSELSRISRNIKDFAEIWEMMKSLGCGFYSLRESFDTTTAAGEMVLYSLANIAQFERRQVSERVAASVRARGMRGLYNGGPIPLGYKSNPESPGYPLLDQPMADCVKRAFDVFKDAGTLAAAAKRLNEEGWLIKRQMEGGSRYQRNPQFTVDNLHKVLKNSAYIGIKKVKERDGSYTEYKAVWAPIVEKDVFDEVQKMLQFNRGRAKPANENRYPYILSGLVYCAKCSSIMCGKSAHGRKKKIGYYEHSWLTKRNSTLSKKLLKCEPHRVLAKRLEPIVWEDVRKVILDPKFAKALLEKAKIEFEDGTEKKVIDGIKAKIHGINSQVDALTERLGELPKGVSATSIYKQMEKLESIRAELQEKLGKMKTESAVLEKPIDYQTFESFLAGLKAFITPETPPETKAALMKKLVSKVKVKPDGVDIEYFVGEDYFTRELEAAASGSRPFFVPETDSNLHPNQGSKQKRHPNPHSNRGAVPFKNIRGMCSNNLTSGAR